MELRRLNVGLITTVSGRWPKELPANRNEEYTKWLARNVPIINIISTGRIAVNEKDVEDTTEFFRKSSVDLVILLIGAFTGDSAAAFIGEELKVPVILWAPYEPPFDGGRLMANSLVAATMNSAALNRLGIKYHFIYGSYTDKRVQGEITGYIKVYDAIKKLRSAFLGLIGYRPTAFYSSTFNETLIRKLFGIKMEEFDLKVIFDMAEKVDTELVQKDAAGIRESVRIEDLPEGYLENHSRLYLSLKEFLKEQGFNALSLKCWPEMGFLKYTPCAVLSRFADEGFVIGCENDIDATITMLIQKYLSGRTVFMSDLISIDEKENTALFWHCGQAAGSLKDPASDIKASNHPLAGQGMVFETTLKPGRITIARMSDIGGVYKLFLVSGEAIPTKKVVKGVMVNVVLDTPVLKTIYKIAEEGVPHHYSLVWDDVAEEMKLMCKVLGIEVIRI